MKILSSMKLFDDKYLVELETCLAVVSVDSQGNLVRVAMFGNNDINKNKIADDEAHQLLVNLLGEDEGNKIQIR